MPEARAAQKYGCPNQCQYYFWLSETVSLHRMKSETASIQYGGKKAKRREMQ
jgi:hypothetical protein